MTASGPIADPWRPHRAWVLDRIIRWSLRHDVAGVHVRGRVDLRPDGITAFVANHTGRWDGFVLWSERFAVRPTGRHLTVMLQQQLSRYRVFQGAGAVGIEPGQPRSVRAMVSALSTWSGPGDSVALFPQGRIFPGDTLPLGFKSLVRVLSHMREPVTVIPTALATEMLHGKKPSIFVSFGVPIALASMSDPETDAEAAVTREVEALRRTLHVLGEDAITSYSHA